MYIPTKQEIIGLAKANPDREICGFICHDTATGMPRVVPCENISREPACSFEIGTADHIRALGTGPILGVYHSHPTVEGFTPPDLACAETMAVPFYVYCLTQGTWHDYLPSTYRPALTGVPFVPGFRDCFELVRLYAREHDGHVISDYDRDETANLRDLIMEKFDLEGYALILPKDIRLGDVLLFKSERALSNHFGVLIGPSRMLHHPMGLLSREDMVTDRWISRMVCAFRLRPEGPKSPGKFV